jgi:hypothetical protein
MVVMSESAGRDEPRTWWKERIKRQIVDLYSAALVGGQRHLEYLVELGMPPDRIFTGYDVVDNAYFARRALEIRNSNLPQSDELQKKYGPVIVSKRCGCVPELVRDNGFTFDPMNEDELAADYWKWHRCQAKIWNIFWKRVTELRRVLDWIGLAKGWRVQLPWPSISRQRDLE